MKKTSAVAPSIQAVSPAEIGNVASDIGPTRAGPKGSRNYAAVMSGHRGPAQRRPQPKGIDVAATPSHRAHAMSVRRMARSALDAVRELDDRVAFSSGHALTANSSGQRNDSGIVAISS